MIEFNKIKVEGFYSVIEPLTYHFDKPGLTIIKGKNGAGKTSIFSALTWVAYGKTLKDKSDFIPWVDKQGKDFKGTKVEVYFKVGGKKYKVIRCFKYKDKVDGYAGKDRLILYENGEVSTLRDKKAIQARVTEIIGYSFDLFKNAILFGQGMERLIDQSSTDIKNILEEAFEATFIKRAREKGDLLKKEKENEIGKLEPQVVSKKADLNSTNLLIAQERENINYWKTNQQGHILRIEKDISVIQDKVSELNKLNFSENQKQKLGKLNGKVKEVLVLINNHSTEVFKLGLQKDSAKSKVESLTNELKGISDALTKVQTHCPRCSQPLNKDLVEKEKETLKKQHRELIYDIRYHNGILNELMKSYEELKNGNSSIAKYKSKEVSYKLKIKELEDAQKQGELANNSIKMLKQQLSDKNSELIEIQSKKVSTKNLKILKNNRKELIQQIKPLRVELKKLRKEYDLLLWAIKDPLSNTGLKAYIFDTMVNQINRELVKYSAYTGYQVEFNIDLESGRKDFYIVIYQGDYPRNYYDLSGGQKQLVNVCIAFAIHDVMGTNKDCNILIMDEIFENLDADNVEVVSSIVRDKAHYKCLHLITHRSEFIYTNCHLVNLQLDSHGCTVKV